MDQERRWRTFSPSRTARCVAFRHPEGIGRTIVVSRRARRRNLAGHGWERSKVGDECLDIFLIPIRGVIPNHTLPMERPPLRCDTAADRSRNLGVTPRADAGFWIACDIPRPKCPERFPTHLESAASIGPVTERARSDSEDVLSTLNQSDLFRIRERWERRCWDLRSDRIRDGRGWNAA